VNDIPDPSAQPHHAVIGPNGAGKSTLANLAGDLPPTAGRIQLGARRDRLDTREISRHGLGRSYQKTNIFTTRSPSGKRAWPRTPAARGTLAGARLMLQLCRPTLKDSTGVAPANRHHSVAGTVSHGEQRQLEIATWRWPPLPPCCCSTNRWFTLVWPRLNVAWSRCCNPSNKTMLLVEHDMDAVFALADRLTVWSTAA
jgi:branched-chain amino acid transport system ATP-binding protein